MDTKLNVDDIRSRLDEMDWQESESGGEERSVFIGTVFQLYPSGKYYTSFANSNVTENEAAEDEEWREEVEQELSEYGLFLFSGDGDPCDLFVGECRDS